MSKLSLRLRLALAFTLAMALVLAGAGALVHVRLGAELLEQLDEGLEARARTLETLLVERGRLDPAALAAGDEDGFAQLLGRDGALLASSASAGAGPLLAGTALATRRSRFLTVEAPPGVDGASARIHARAVQAGGEPAHLVVGASLEDREEALAGLRTALLTGGPLALGLAGVGGYLLAGAALRPVEAMRRRAAEISADRPEARLPLPPGRDEVRRLGVTLNELLDRLEAGRRRERRFVADASHELRTPLALLRTELELALRRPRTQQELERALRSAAVEADRLARLAEDPLALSQLDASAAPLRRDEMDAADLLGAVAERFASRAAAEGRTIEVAGARLRVTGDRLRLERALANLVDNALRHGGGAVRLSASRRDGMTELEVLDEGRGFPASFLPHAFERFAQADEARTGDAAGLGLALVAAVAHAHGGTARAANRAGAGAVVTIALPGSA